MKKPLIVGNWKANPKTEREAKNLIKNIEKGIARKKVVFGCAVPDIFLKTVKEEGKHAICGVQNVGTFTQGALTGLSSPEMYVSAKADFAILGHSEVRARGETNEIINEKLKVSFANKLPIILCVGEKKRDGHGEYLKEIESEIKECLRSIKKEDASLLTIAYEPVWAVGGDTSATEEECFEAVIAIRRTLASLFTLEYAKKILVIYGGTVTKDNAANFIREGGADGLLIGRASLNAKDFIQIILTCYARP